jgi:hypothetical protein
LISPKGEEIQIFHMANDIFLPGANFQSNQANKKDKVVVEGLKNAIQTRRIRTMMSENLNRGCLSAS